MSTLHRRHLADLHQHDAERQHGAPRDARDVVAARRAIGAIVREADVRAALDDRPRCAWCGAPLADEQAYYCSTRCGVEAEVDSND